MEYQHTQTGALHHILVGASAVLLVGAWLARADPTPSILLAIVGVLVFPVAFAFVHLTVQDEVDCLAIRFGPLPLFGKRIPYAEITRVEPDRTRFLDGWGIHYVPGRGWTYNVWGFDCVKLTLGKRVFRVGSDDVENLVEFLRKKVARPE